MAPLIRFIRQLGFVRWGNSATPRGVDDDRVLHLFRNRAELKKAYGGLQDEVHRLTERIKQQEGATARVQEMLHGLEARLSQPETAYPALVFYQARELWALGRALLTQFVAELATQQEERERRAFLAERNRQLFSRRQSVEAALQEAESRAADARATVAQLEQRLAQLRRFWHYFRRRALRQQLQAAQLQSLLCVQDLEAARAARDALEAEPLPEFAGVSLDARRAINMAAIAYGQVLCDRLARSGLVELAREAASRREPPREEYGDRAHCEGIMLEIARARVTLQGRTNLTPEIKQRSDRLRDLAKYRAAADTVPTAESLGSAMDGSQVLADDLWEIYRVLLR
jgi:DNA repair exonuclease SbcCD ATPase subunit